MQKLQLGHTLLSSFTVTVKQPGCIWRACVHITRKIDCIPGCKIWRMKFVCISLYLVLKSSNRTSLLVNFENLGAKKSSGPDSELYMHSCNVQLLCQSKSAWELALALLILKTLQVLIKSPLCVCHGFQYWGYIVALTEP